MNNGFVDFAQTIITGNLILVQGLGLYALTRYTKDVKEATKTGLTTLGAMLIGGLILWILGDFVPNSLSVEIGFYLLVGTVAALAAQKLGGQKLKLEDGLVDSALVGLLLLMGRDGVTGVNNLWVAFGGGLGYSAALVVMATLRERLKLAPIPKALRGTPIILITAGLLAVALLGFRL